MPGLKQQQLSFQVRVVTASKTTEQAVYARSTMDAFGQVLATLPTKEILHGITAKPNRSSMQQAAA